MNRAHFSPLYNFSKITQKLFIFDFLASLPDDSHFLHIPQLLGSVTLDDILLGSDVAGLYYVPRHFDITVNHQRLVGSVRVNTYFTIVKN
jgi:hypothetical protein